MLERSQMNQSDAQEYSLFQEVLFLVALLSVCSFIVNSLIGIQSANAATFAPNVSATLTYSCSSSHCYGRNEWQGATSGALTDISVVHLSSGNNFVDDEMWVAQPSSSGDCAGNGNFCWVEAGYANGDAENGEIGQYFYWADVRPCSCGGYHEHDSGILKSGDYGNEAGVGIFKDDSSDWGAYVDGTDTSVSGVSTGQTMQATMILIGQELAGTSGANAPTAHFTYNYWQDQNNGSWHFQTSDGTLDPCLDNQCSPINPPWAGWVANQTPHNGNGGNFYTCTLPGNNNPC